MVEFDHSNCHHKLGWIFIGISIILILISIILVFVYKIDTFEGMIPFLIAMFIIICPLQMTCENWGQY